MDKKVWQAGMDALVESTPLLGPALVAMSRAAKESEEASNSNDIQVLSEEESRQRIELSMAEMQAKVAQEIAIARRIEEADEVEIEEYYERESEGNAGITAEDSRISVGIAGKGSRVTKRVYRFRRHP